MVLALSRVYVFCGVIFVLEAPNFVYSRCFSSNALDTQSSQEIVEVMCVLVCVFF